MPPAQKRTLMLEIVVDPHIHVLIFLKQHIGASDVGMLLAVLHFKGPKALEPPCIV